MRRILCVAVLLGACVGDLPPRECVQNSDCLQDTHNGTCLASTTGSSTKWCAFPAMSCVGNLKWGVLAGDGLANTCVVGLLPDGPLQMPVDAGIADSPASSTDGGGPDAFVVDAGPIPDAGPAALTIDQTTYTFSAIAPGQSAMRAFAITNVGLLPSGPVAVTMGGSDASAFALDASGCQGKMLAAGTSCSVTVTFSTSTEPTKHGLLMASATPGGTVMSTLDGSGLAPAALSADPPSLAFGTVTKGSSPSIGLTIRNGGALATATLTTAITGTDAGLFTTMSDTCNGHALAATSTCSLTVVFAASVVGTKGATLTVGGGGKTATVPLSGAVVLPGALSMTPPVPTFTSVALGGSSSASITVKNTGGTALTSLATSVSGANMNDFSFSTDTCNGHDLAGGASCMLTIKFQPAAAGIKSASLAVSASSGGSVTTTLSATATANLSVVFDGNGSGTVASNPDGISCRPGTSCSHDFAASSVQLTASADTNSTFTGWSGVSGCPGTTACTVPLSAAQTVHASFVLKTYTLQIAKSGTGTGTISDSSGVISCGPTCSVSVNAGSTLLLTEMPDAHNKFGAWSNITTGASICAGADTCLVTVNGPLTIGASFTKLSTLTILIFSQGSASRVVSGVNGIT